MICFETPVRPDRNPAAREDKGSPIYGMPVLEVDKAQHVFVIKRSMNPGFAGIQNPLFFHDNTMMIFGDAKGTVLVVDDEEDVRTFLLTVFADAGAQICEAEDGVELMIADGPEAWTIRARLSDASAGRLSEFAQAGADEP